MAALFEFLTGKRMVPMKDLGPIECALSMNIQVDRLNGLLKISNTPYIETVLERFGMTDCSPAKTPMVEEQLSPMDWPTLASEKERMQKLPFRQLLGCLWWVAWCTRPDILVAVYECSKHVEHPSPKLWEALKRILRYLKGTSDWGIVMQREKLESGDLGLSLLLKDDFDHRQQNKADLETKAQNKKIKAYVDGDWASCLIDRHSRSGGLIYFLGQPVGWMCEMQSSIALSSTESEFYGLVKIGKLVIWLHRLVSQLRYNIDGPVPVYCDNKSAIALSQKDHFPKRSKHFDVHSKIVQKWVRDDKIIDVVHLNTDDQPADCLTKPLQGEKFRKFRDYIMGEYALQTLFPCLTKKKST